MIRKKPWTVELNGVRSNPDHCFYCGEKVGGTHKRDCVIRQRTVVVRATIEYIVNVPESWSPEQIESHRNTSSWCSNNGIDEIANLEPEHWCPFVTWEYVREATEEDERAFSLTVENTKG